MNTLHRWVWTVTVGAAVALFLAAASPSWAGQLADGQSQEQARQGAIAPVDLGDGISPSLQQPKEGYGSLGRSAY